MPEYTQVTLDDIKRAMGEEFYGSIKVDPNIRMANGKQVQNVSLAVIVGKARGFVNLGIWEQDIATMIPLLKNYNGQTGVVKVFNLHERQGGERTYFDCSHMSFANFFDGERNAAYKQIAEQIDATLAPAAKAPDRANVPLQQHRYEDPKVTQANSVKAPVQSVASTPRRRVVAVDEE